MFHRVAPPSSQAESSARKPADNASKQGAQPAARENNDEKKEAASKAPETNTPTQNQQPVRKDTQTMNADSSDNKSMPHGNYSPTPAQPQNSSRMDIPGARPTPARPAASYPGAQNTSSGYSPQPAANASQDGNKKLQIGPGITLSGEIEDCEYLYVEGTVEAALKGASVLEIAESGAFYGTVEIDEATIAGRFEGDLTVRGRLTIEATGSITGSVAYKELAVEAGATLDGKVSPIGGAKVSEGNFRKGKAKKTANNASSAENELPFSDKASATAAE
jgi:cytoskeletal protein CcmA (bactofilin family)